jgi:hypothetical protein
MSKTRQIAARGSRGGRRRGIRFRRSSGPRSSASPCAGRPRRWVRTAIRSLPDDRIVEEALGGEYTVTVQPYTSPTVAMKAVMDGNGEIAYTADIGMTSSTARRRLQGYKPKMPEIAHTWYSYPMESMMAVAAKDADKYRCWKDFSGKPVFYTNAGFMNWLNWQRIYKALGYEFKHVQIDLKSNADDAVRHDRRLRHLHHRRPSLASY